MKEIKFRGLDKQKKEWVYGYFYTFGDRSFILEPGKPGIPEQHIEVKSDSVGQYTGLKDKNGVEIYEGDIIQYQHVLGEEYWEKIKIEWSESLAGWIIDRRDSGLSVVIGNVHENPELLNV